MGEPEAAWCWRTEQHRTEAATAVVAATSQHKSADPTNPRSTRPDVSQLNAQRPIGQTTPPDQHQLTVRQISPVASKVPGASWRLNQPAGLFTQSYLNPRTSCPWALYWWWTLDVAWGGGEGVVRDYVSNGWRKKKKKKISHYQWHLLWPSCLSFFSYLCGVGGDYRNFYKQAHRPGPFPPVPGFLQHRMSSENFQHGCVTPSKQRNRPPLFWLVPGRDGKKSFVTGEWQWMDISFLMEM